MYRDQHNGNELQQFILMEQKIKTYDKHQKSDSTGYIVMAAKSKGKTIGIDTNFLVEIKKEEPS